MGDGGGHTVEARAIHKVSNALQLTFLDQAGDEPLAVAVQGAADGKGAKFATLLGFKNGGVGTHVVTYRGGAVMHVKSVNLAPTQVTRPDGVTLAVIDRGETESIARGPGGTEIVRFVGRPDGVKTLDAFRLMITAADGSELGSLDIIRTVAGWNLFSDLYWELTLWNQHAAPLKLPFLGTRVKVDRTWSEPERDAIIAACVDIAIGLRPYVKEMS
jgi:hypothetical protein